MGCCCCCSGQGGRQPRGFEDGKRSWRNVKGYTPELFARDHLVPIEGYACRTPHGRTPTSRQRREELEQELSKLNERLTEALRETPKQHKRRRRRKGMAASNAPPPEAICRVLLQQARHTKLHVDLQELEQTISKNSGLASEPFQEHLDWQMDFPMDFEIDGRLIFPPSAPWEDLATASPHTRRRRKAEEVDISDRMVLAITVTAVVSEDADRLLVKCEDLKIEFTEAKQGDPMIDSWLPCDEVLNDIQKMLSDRLNAGISGVTEDLRV